MRKKIIFLVVMLLLCCVNINAFAMENSELEKYSYEIASDHLKVLNIDFKIVSSTPLYDMADKQSGVWYHLEDENDNKGYIIVSVVDDTLELTEFSIHNDLNLDKSSRIYYNGLTGYVKKVNGKFIESDTGKEIKNHYVMII